MVNFKNEFTVTKSIYVKQRFNPWILYVGILSAIGVIIFVFLKLWGLVLATLLLPVFLFGYSFWTIDKLKRKYDTKLSLHEGKPNEVTTIFYTDCFEFHDTYGMNQKLSYKAISKVHKRGDLIVFDIDRGFSLSVKKDGFTKGTLKEFTYFMLVRGFNV